jgi:hypothetical protein
MAGTAHNRRSMEKARRRQRWGLIVCAALSVLTFSLAGCQTIGEPAIGTAKREILPLALWHELLGTKPAAETASASEPLPADATASSADVTNDYPIARLLHNDKLIPSNDRNWVPEHQVLSTAEFSDDARVTVHNVRNAEWLTAVDCIVRRDDRSYDLNDLQTVDFIVVPFKNQSIAHTMLSFGFGHGTYLGVSAEVRVEQGEAYNAALGLARQFELIYVIADEHDLLPVRAKYRDADVFVYRTTATPAQAQAMFKDVMARVNQLARTPEFYDTLSNNCTTNILRHVNHLSPDRVPYDTRVLLPGYADQLAYQLGLLDRRLPFAEVKRRAWSNERIIKYDNDPDFSARIRQ